MKNDRLHPERRQHQRYAVPKTAFAFLRNESIYPGQITEISLGGMAFQYASKNGSSPEASKIDIVSADYTEAVLIRHLDIQKVSDLAVSKENGNEIRSIETTDCQIRKSHPQRGVGCNISSGVTAQAVSDHNTKAQKRNLNSLSIKEESIFTIGTFTGKNIHDIGTAKFFFRSDWPLCRPAAGLNPVSGC